MKIMIVDDHADMRRMIRTIISAGGKWKDEIIECEDGDEAVAQFATHHPDCILMDVQMRSMNGFEATEKIYQNDPQASVIFVTSHDTAAFRSKASMLHAKGFITKDKLSELDQLIHHS